MVLRCYSTLGEKKKNIAVILKTTGKTKKKLEKREFYRKTSI